MLTFLEVSHLAGLLGTLSFSAKYSFPFLLLFLTFDFLFDYDFDSFFDRSLLHFSSISGPLGTPKMCVAPARELNFHCFDHFSRGRFSTPKIAPKLTPKSPQNDLKMKHLSLIFGSWAALGASRSDFGRSQSAPGALWELFEII